MKRISVWVDSPDKCVDEVRRQLRDFLTRAGLRHMISEAVEIIEKE